MSRIVSILPKGEGFSPTHFGAVSLCVRDFTAHSRYRTNTTILGTVPKEGFEGFRYIACPQTRWYESRTRSYARQCVDVLRKEPASLVEVHNRPNLLRLIAAKVPGKYALHLHNDPQEIEYTRTPEERRKLLEIADGVYCVSNYIRSRFLEGLDAQAEAKVHLVYNGLALPATLPTKEKLIVFAGRLTEDKGALPLAQALRIALPQLPDWKAALIGSRKHGVKTPRTPYEAQVETILAPIGNQVEMPGFLPHEATLEYFARAAIAAIPSLWAEPFGRTALEAMASGCATVSSGRGGLGEVTGDAALTLSGITPQALSDAMLKLAANPAERERLGNAGRMRAEHFSIAECTRMLDNARDAILGSSHDA